MAEAKLERLERELSRWLGALRGKLSLPIDQASPHRSELAKTLWIQLHVPPASSIQDHAQWIHALRLLDTLAAGGDRRLCWELIVDLCAKPRVLGCPLELLSAMRPRFELHFDQHVVPTEELVTLLLHGGEGVVEASDSSFAEVEARLSRSSDVIITAPALLRFYFAFGKQASCSDCRASSCRVSAARYLKHVLACAGRVTSPLGREEATRRRFQVESFGFGTWSPEILRQIACKIPLHAVRYFGTSTSRDHFFGPFIWRLLAPHDNVRANLGLRHLEIVHGSSWTHKDEVVAACSAISSSRVIDELSFKDLEEYRLNSRWPAWLAFALFSKTARHQIRTVRLTLGKLFGEYVDAIKQLIDHESDQSDHAVDKTVFPIQWPPTTVLVNAATKIHGFELPDDNRATTVYHGKGPVECFVASADYGASARILVPGVGTGCVPRDQVLSQQPARLRETHSIRNLSLEIDSFYYADVRRNRRTRPFDAASVVEMLRLVGEPLEQLTVTSIDYRPTDPLRVDDLLAHCPHLKSLRLVNLTLSADQLFASKHGHALQSLTLLSCRLLDQPRPLGRAAYVSPSAFPRITSLYIDPTGTTAVSGDAPDLPSVHEYILELADQRRLHRLVVRCKDTKQRARYATHVARHDGEPIPVLPLREKLAFLSVATTGPSASPTAKYELTMDVATLIFEMASVTLRRRVCTLLGEGVD